MLFFQVSRFIESQMDQHTLVLNKMLVNKHMSLQQECRFLKHLDYTT